MHIYIYIKTTKYYMVPTSSNNVQTNTVHFCNFTQASEDELRRAKPLEVPEFPLHTHTLTVIAPHHSDYICGVMLKCIIVCSGERCQCWQWNSKSTSSDTSSEWDGHPKGCADQEWCHGSYYSPAEGASLHSLFIGCVPGAIWGGKRDACGWCWAPDTEGGFGHVC